MVSLHQFKYACETQNVMLDSTFYADASADVYMKPFAYGPNNHVFRAVTHAAWLLRQKTRTPLVQTEKQLSLAPFKTDVTMHTLARIINCTLQPAPANSGPYDLPGPARGSINVCEDNEKLWTRALEDHNMEAARRPMAQFFTDDGTPEGRLIAARKLISLPSGITFAEVNIDGIVYPPGSLLMLSKQGDQPSRRDARTIEPHGYGYAVYNASDITAAAAMRLSGFALPLVQRTEYDVDSFTPTPTLEALQRCARTSMLTTVAPQS